MSTHITFSPSRPSTSFMLHNCCTTAIHTHWSHFVERVVRFLTHSHTHTHNIMLCWPSRQDLMKSFHQPQGAQRCKCEEGMWGPESYKTGGGVNWGSGALFLREADWVTDWLTEWLTGWLNELNGVVSTNGMGGVVLARTQGCPPSFQRGLLRTHSCFPYWLPSLCQSSWPEPMALILKGLWGSPHTYSVCQSWLSILILASIVHKTFTHDWIKVVQEMDERMNDERMNGWNSHNHCIL